MKWEEFVKHCEDKGVRDDTVVCNRDMNFGGSAGEIEDYDLDYEKDSNVLLISSPWFPDLD